MTLSNYQVQYNGITVGSGNPYVVENIDGLGTAPLRIQDDNRGYIDGSYSGRDFYDGRVITIDILVVGDNSNSAQYYFNQLQLNWAPQSLGYYVDPTVGVAQPNALQQLAFRLTSATGDKVIWVRPRGITVSIDPEFTYGYIKCRAEFYAPDPRYYDSSATTVSGTSVSVTNSGWAISCPVITIASTTATSGSITDGTTTMSFANITTGQNLTIDLLQRIIYYNSVPTRNVMTASSNGWLSIPAYTTVANTWTSTVGSMSVAFRNAYA